MVSSGDARQRDESELIARIAAGSEKAFVTLVSGREPSRELALDIFTFTRRALAPYKRIRRLEFCELPKTISGKIRRVELRRQESERRAAGERVALEFFEDEFER